ncbi:MAG TPA: ATP-binding protein [Terriglobales bacterium]|nr:ATP-binding protein [Terriglobales bacterium]
MQGISAEDIIERIRTENPWWEEDHAIDEAYHKLKRRSYFDLFYPLLTQPVRRAIVLMGPRRVGKTVLIYHAIQSLIDDGVPPQAIGYFSVDNPIYNGLSIQKLLEHYGQSSGVNYKLEQVFIFFDEIQYLRDWEVQLKSAVDTYKNIKFTASGSAAAALRLKSTESGAGRFTDFMLPPLTFHEYLYLLNKTDLVQAPVDRPDGLQFFVANDIEKLNEQFISYLNFGGYPEAIFSATIQADPGRFIKSDIIDKVLLRDLPSLYGIENIQELNYLFTTLAFNTANEVSLGELSKNSGVTKNTIKRYIEYLEAAFLIKLVYRVDQNAKRFRRANFFKVYLTNPSMRAALFSPVKMSDSAVGPLAETGIFSQWFHHSGPLHYARWHDGEVDIVQVSEKEQRPDWAVEVKWSDRFCEHPEELKSLVAFCRANKVKDPLVTSMTKTCTHTIDDVRIQFEPASLYCYTVGHNLIHNRAKQLKIATSEQNSPATTV